VFILTTGHKKGIVGKNVKNGIQTETPLCLKTIQELNKIKKPNLYI